MRGVPTEEKLEEEEGVGCFRSTLLLVVPKKRENDESLVD